MNNELFGTAHSLFVNRLNEVIKDHPTKNLIEDLIRLTMFKNAEKDDKALVLVELYNLLGTTKFMEVMDLLSDKSFHFPSKESFKESIQTALCYYYKTYRDMDWDQIKEVLEDQELSSLKLGIKISQLEKFMTYIGELIQKRHPSGK